MPPARNGHAACCIAGSLLMVVGGLSDGLNVLSDVWLLDVTNGSWSEVLHTHIHVHVHGVYIHMPSFVLVM